jgi:hypothetical protein
MSSGADHVQAAEAGDPLAVTRAAAEPDVGSASRHLRGDRDRSIAAGLGDDRGLCG